MKEWVYGCVFGGWGTKGEDWGVIQSLHKWIWLIEAASDPDWYTAGAPLIGEGEEWRRKWIGMRQREYGPQSKNKKHLCCNSFLDRTKHLRKQTQ